MIHEAKPITAAKTSTPQEKPPITPASPLAKPVMQTKPVGTVICTYQGHAHSVYAVAWSPDWKRIASGDAAGKVQVWDTTTERKSVFTYNHTARVSAIIWSHGGKRLASASSDKTVQVWDITANSKLFTFKHEGPVHTVAWSPDGKYIASGGDDKIVHVWVAP
jgi:eukaryotic-like serine/threonine-protein kinase